MQFEQGVVVGAATELPNVAAHFRLCPNPPPRLLAFAPPTPGESLEPGAPLVLTFSEAVVPALATHFPRILRNSMRLLKNQERLV